MGKRVRTHVNPLGITREESFAGFGNQNPIMVDVGAFKGEFSAQLAQDHPDHNFILFEIRIPIYQKLKARFEDQSNIAVFPGDAARNFERILRPCQEQGAMIKYIFINFPDPWLKDKHKKRRFIQTSSLKDWAKWLNPQSQFIFQTDQLSLFQDTKALLPESPYVHAQDFDTPPFGIRTDWEKAKTQEGKAISRMIFSQDPVKILPSPFLS